MRQKTRFTFWGMSLIVLAAALALAGCRHDAAGTASATPFSSGSTPPAAMTAGELQRIMNDPAASPQAKARAVAQMQRQSPK